MKGGKRKERVREVKNREKELTNIFSREKSLLYFCMWDDSDRVGIALLGETVKNNLFIVPSKGKKGSVWYEKDELASLKQKVLENLKTHKNNSVWIKLKRLMKTSWRFLKPYAKEQKKIKDVEEFNLYYRHLIDFWTCLNSFIYSVMDDSAVDKLIKKGLSQFRDETEQYTEKMSLVLMDYIKKQSLLKEISFVITKTEAEAIIRKKMKTKELMEIRSRLNGCFMLNKKVYLFKKIKTVLKEKNLAFERLSGEKDSVKGTVAFKGLVKGCVKVVHSFEDLNKVKTGDVLVTEMTNPKYVPTIKKACAIITNEGGSLCHAAIVSRELGIPCVIGTKIATKVLKDGDYVEVDANKGIVKKVTKKEYETWIKELEKEEASTEVSRIPPEALEVEISPKLISWFDSVDKKDLLLVGGKGANLGEIFGEFPVPNGFCVTVNAYKKFLKQNKLENKIFPLLNRLDIENTEELDKASKKIEGLIIKSSIPKDVEQEIIANYKKLKEGFVAVRSSATAEDLPTASFAGQQDTYLNVKGEEDLLDCVKKCWASLFTARAIYYRVINKFHHQKVLISVLIQEMIESEKAGVMFSINPVTNNHNEIIIEGSYGLGEMVVSGQVTPDSYIVEKKSLKVKNVRINEKKIALYLDPNTDKNKKIGLDSEKAFSQCLTEEEIKALAELAIKIENHYGKPQDIEWAVGPDEKIYILQSRPVTTIVEEDTNKGVVRKLK